MGQKTHPRGLRLGIIETWDSQWYSDKQYADWLHEDLKIQNFIKEQLFRASIAKVETQRFPGRCIVNVHTARPGIVIGRRGVEIEKLTSALESLVNKDIKIVISEVKRPELNAQLVAEGIAIQLERRVAYKTAMKKAVSNAMRMNAKGIKILCSGRLSGHEMARKEFEIEGRVPLHTLRARIDYGFAEALTTYGKIGVKVWIFMGEVIGEIDEEEKVVELPSTRGITSRRELPEETLETEEVISKIRGKPDEESTTATPIGRRQRRHRPSQTGQRRTSTGGYRQQRTTQQGPRGTSTGDYRQRRASPQGPRRTSTGDSRQRRTTSPGPRGTSTGDSRQRRASPPRERRREAPPRTESPEDKNQPSEE